MSAFGSPQSVAGLVVLLALTDLGSGWEQLAFHLENQDASSPVTMIVDVSQGGTYVNKGREQPIVVDAQSEGSMLIDAPNEFTNAGLSVQTAGPAVNIRWALLGRHRR